MAMMAFKNALETGAVQVSRKVLTWKRMVKMLKEMSQMRYRVSATHSSLRHQCSHLKSTVTCTMLSLNQETFMEHLREVF